MTASCSRRPTRATRFGPWLPHGLPGDPGQLAAHPQFLWLPLSHLFAKVLIAAQLWVGFRTAVDGRSERIIDNLAVVKPTFVAAVPRIFEKVRAKVIAGAATGLKRRIFDWAFAVGRKAMAQRLAGRRPGGLQLALAHKLVFSKLHARFGGNLRFFISGSAPLAEFFLRITDRKKDLIKTSGGKYVAPQAL